jgi:two-component system, LytTR family, response regulator
MDAIVIPNLKFSEIILTENIILCKGSGSYSEIILTDKSKLVISKNLQWLEQKLIHPGYFSRVHKSYIVNVFHINKIYKMGNLICLSNGAEIPVSRSKKHLILKFFEELSKKNNQLQNKKQLVHLQIGAT